MRNLLLGRTWHREYRLEISPGIWTSSPWCPGGSALLCSRCRPLQSGVPKLVAIQPWSRRLKSFHLVVGDSLPAVPHPSECVWILPDWLTSIFQKCKSWASGRIGVPVVAVYEAPPWLRYSECVLCYGIVNDQRPWQVSNHERRKRRNCNLFFQLKGWQVSQKLTFEPTASEA